MGVIFDNKLTFKAHINYISTKISKNLGILFKIRRYLNFNTRIKLYYALIYPFLLYGICIWGSVYKTRLDILFKLQKDVYVLFLTYLILLTLHISLRIIIFWPYTNYTYGEFWLWPINFLLMRCQLIFKIFLVYASGHMLAGVPIFLIFNRLVLI